MTFQVSVILPCHNAGPWIVEALRSIAAQSLPVHEVLVIDDDSAVKRLLARGRNDDTEEAIRKRLAWTKTQVFPQLQLLKERGRTIHEIDGEPDTETIHQNILKALQLT